MIIFNNAGHCFVSAPVSQEPIVWVDAKDISTYTLSGNDVTNLDNKGTLGGVMTLNGSVKFANGGFESWSNSDYINYNLNEPFLTNNSFTVVTTFKLNTNNSNTKLFSSVYGDDNNNYSAVYDDSLIYQVDYRGSQDGKFEDSESSVNGLQTLIYTINNIGNRYAIKLMSSGNNTIELDTEAFDNVNDAVIYLLNDTFLGANSGQNNPLYEFRLYDRLFTLTEMQDLQTELNNKHLILGNELVVNGDFSNGLNNWNDNSGGTISIVNDKLVCNSSNGTFIFQSGVLDSSKLYKFTFEVSNYVSGAVYARSSPINGVEYQQNGVYSDIIQGGNNKSLGGVNFIGTIDNISVKEILN